MVHFILHRDGDSVGVIVTEGVQAGMDLDGWVMDEDRMVRKATWRKRIVSPKAVGHFDEFIVSSE